MSIDLICQVQGQRKYYRTGLKFYKENWSTENQTPIFNRQTDISFIKIEEAKQEMSELRTSIKNIEKEIYAASNSLFIYNDNRKAKR